MFDILTLISAEQEGLNASTNQKSIQPFNKMLMRERGYKNWILITLK